MPNRVNILIVDDQEANLTATEALLHQSDLHILKANSGDDALNLLLQHEVALALLDVNMPNMDGFELAEIMRSNLQTRTIPIIFMTAAIQEPRTTFAGYQLGAVDFLHKPFEPNILLSKVKVFVEMYLQKRLLAGKVSELEEALRVNEIFVAVLGHDLRTPLSALQNGAETISRFPMLDTGKRERIANVMLSSTKRMNDMVNQLLEVARARSNTLSLNLGRYDYAEIAFQIVQEFSNADGSEAIVLSLSGDTSGDFDKTRMLQVLSNLVGNAFQHGSADEVIELQVDGSLPAQIRIEVVNGGMIPSAMRLNIFDPFRRMSTQESRNPSGLGLGLYIIKQFVIAHGGNVTVHSENGRTRFSIIVPRFIDV